MSKETMEKKVQSFANPNLLAKPFHCEGASLIGEFPTAPKKTECGLQINYVTLSARNYPIEDMRDGYRGCKYFSNDLCVLDDIPCPVAAVASIKDFRERIKELKRLRYVPS